MKRTPLKPRKGIARVSKRRAQRLERIQARGPVCEEAKRRLCSNCGKHGTDPMHLDRVGKGYGDWAAGKLMWVCRVSPGCRECHDRLDGNAQPPMGPHEIARVHVGALKLGDEWCAAVGVSPFAEMHPYEQWKLLGSPDPGDML